MTVFIGTILGVWSGVRHAPTRRARLLMLKTVLEYYVFCSCYVWINAFLQRFVLGMIYSSSGYRNFIGYWSLSFVFLLPVLVVLNTIRVNRQWRQCVEFDSGISEKTPKPITRKYVIALLATALGAHLVYFGIHIVFFAMTLVEINSVLVVKCLLPFLYLITLIIFLLCGWRISRDDAAFAKAPPRLPNLLPILTGEEPWPKGFRNRINFWGDLTAMGLGVFYLQFLFLEWFLRSMDMARIGFQAGNSHIILAGFSLAAYLGFAVFYAGIPRRRYRGMIILVGTVFVCNLFFISYSGIWLFAFYYALMEFAMVFGMSTWYLLCFALTGVAGLWVFRKKT